MPFTTISAVFVAVALAAPAGTAHAEVRTGIDVLSGDGFKSLQGKRLGLITNATGRDRTGRSTAQSLAEAPGVHLNVIFAPEHGITGSSEIDAIADSKITLAGRSIPVRSLSPSSIEHMRPLPEDLKDLDALVFDVQDIGTRYYTYLATMGIGMEAAAAAGIEFIVLDRPNPIGGGVVEGPILDNLSLRRETPTAYFPTSVRHGMTAGEVALMYNAELKHPRLTIVKMIGWSRSLWFDETGLSWTPPSPNIPDLEAALMYSGIGLFEASNLAVGRGTPVPFRWIGAPWLNADKVVTQIRAANLAGIEVSAQDYTPSKSVFENKLCHGVRFTVVDRNLVRPTQVFLAAVAALHAVHPRELEWSWRGAERMAGTTQFQKIYEAGADLAKLRELFESGAADFSRRRTPYLLY